MSDSASDMMNQRSTRRRVLRTLVFMTEIENDFHAWERAIHSYVIQNTKIEEVYDLVDKLGRGSFGFVVLG